MPRASWKPRADYDLRVPIDLNLYLEHTQGRSLVEVLLRGHLWVEQHLVALLETELKRPEALNLDRMAFAQKVNLADALGMVTPDDAGTLRILNGMRNRLAHDLTGQPTEEDVARLESSVSESQRGLANKLLPLMAQAPGLPEARLCRRLSAVLLALLTEMEQHRQRHAYWREHRSAMEGYRTMVAIMENLGATPETEEEYRKALSIPEPPTPADAITTTQGQ